jgi:hypothetical protein
MPGFTNELKDNVKNCKLFTLKVSSSLGSAFLAAKHVGHHLPLDTPNNLQLLHSID